MQKAILTIVLTAALLSGCVSSTTGVWLVEDEALPDWMQEIVAYQSTLPPNHPHQIENLFALTDSIRETAKSKFGSMRRSVAVRRLANWLVSEEGHAMEYDVNANFSPIQAFEKKRGNCLSFTVLLTSLAAELGIDIKYNEVDLPNVWSLQDDRSFVLYRHVNGLYKSARNDVIFDLAMENYDYNYPQRVISEESAAAKLLSNRGVAALGRNNNIAAEHYLKLAVSLDPNSSDSWVNYGVFLKRQKLTEQSEQAFLHSFFLNDRNSTAASNLERLYRNAGKQRLANRYQKISDRLRHTNPYYHFQLAQKYYGSGLLNRSRRAINRAKKLNDTDPRFYELSSRLYQQEDDLARAFNELRKAHSLEADVRVRGRYALKALRLNQLAMESIENRKGDSFEVNFIDR